jgi:hypothetical protein
MSEAIQVRIVVVYCETKVFLLLLSDRLLDFTRRRRSRRNSSRCCRRACERRGRRGLRKRANRQREGGDVDNDESVHSGRFDHRMRLAPSLDSTISSLPRQLKVAPRGRLDIICVPFKNCGCSSVVEHLLAKEYRSLALTFSQVLLSAFHR